MGHLRKRSHIKALAPLVIAGSGEKSPSGSMQYQKWVLKCFELFWNFKSWCIIDFFEETYIGISLIGF